MFKVCHRCGKIHTSNFTCMVGKQPRRYNGGTERVLRSSYKWTEKSKEIRERAHYLCEVCRDEGLLTYDGLEVHHIIKVKDDEDLLLDNNNLICLCTLHHKAADNNELDKDYLISLAQQREENQNK